MVPSQKLRGIATPARVHPSYLPYLQAPWRRPRAAKWIPPFVALGGIAYGVAAYHQRSQRSTHPVSKADTDRRRRETLADAYGDRDSLESLEEAIRVYESQRR